MVKQWRNATRDSVQFSAWAEPKAARRRLVNAILQQHVNLVCCFRAKRKIAMPTAEQKRNGQKQPIDMGWMPIAGPEYAYEMTALGVLPPGAKGVPDWTCSDPGSEMVIKRPAQFERILVPGQQLSEDMGEAMARWAQGSSTKSAPEEQLLPPVQGGSVEPVTIMVLGEQAEALLAEVANCFDGSGLAATMKAIGSASLSKFELATLRKACKAKKAAFENEASTRTREPGEEG
jgi:hypothetical protein